MPRASLTVNLQQHVSTGATCHRPMPRIVRDLSGSIASMRLLATASLTVSWKTSTLARASADNGHTTAFIPSLRPARSEDLRRVKPYRAAQVRSRLSPHHRCQRCARRPARSAPEMQSHTSADRTICQRCAGVGNHGTVGERVDFRGLGKLATSVPRREKHHPGACYAPMFLAWRAEGKPRDAGGRSGPR